jgi:hypothetical protein
MTQYQFDSHLLKKVKFKNKNLKKIKNISLATVFS